MSEQTHDWKSASFDKLQNFWIKRFSVMHEDLTRAINDMIKGPKSIPTWLTSGITFLLSQGKDTQYPKNYRLITCLLTMYKFLKAALKNRFYKHSEVTFFQKNSKAVTEYLGDVKTSCW